jgi:hypothetical protein
LISRVERLLGLLGRGFRNSGFEKPGAEAINICALGSDVVPQTNVHEVFPFVALVTVRHLQSQSR